MLGALEQAFGHSGQCGDDSLSWNRPAGGMFLWTRLPAGLNAVDLLPLAVEHNVAFVPGSAFYAAQPDPRSMRLSFVTSSVTDINRGVAALAQAIAQAQERSRAPAPA
jgi:2-aminoadipate transaminase